MKPVSICLFLLIFCAGMNIGAAQSIEKISDNDFSIQTKSGVVMMVSREGGRILSFSLGNAEVVTQRSEHEYYGSTLWPGPQSSMSWPPYAALDRSCYAGGIEGDSLKLISAEDSVSGLQFEKVFRLTPDTRAISITYRIRNISEVEHKVDAWEVTRVPSKGGVSFYCKGDSANLPGSNLTEVTEFDGVVWYKPGAVPFEGGQKLFGSAMGGWIGYTRGRILFVKSFKDLSPDQFPPRQGEVEIYANGGRKYVEIENHGEFVSLKPQAALEYRVTWSLIRLPRKEKVVVGNRALVKYAQDCVYKLNK